MTTKNSSLKDNAWLIDHFLNLTKWLVFIGIGLCPKNSTTPPGDGFVHCTSPMSYDGICKNQGPVNVTWYDMLLIIDLPHSYNSPACNLFKFEIALFISQNSLYLALALIRRMALFLKTWLLINPAMVSVHSLDSWS